MADHDLIPTGELPDHFHQIEIVRLAGMPGEHGHGIAAAEHERIVIVRMSLQSCHRIVCREPELVLISRRSATAYTRYGIPFS